MSKSSCRGAFGSSDVVRAPADVDARNEDARHRDVSNEMESTNPEVDATIPDGDTKQLPDTREPSCIV